jgi:hypothetical protein
MLKFMLVGKIGLSSLKNISWFGRMSLSQLGQICMEKMKKKKWKKNSLHGNLLCPKHIILREILPNRDQHLKDESPIFTTSLSQNVKEVLRFSTSKMVKIVISFFAWIFFLSLRRNKNRKIWLQTNYT